MADIKIGDRVRDIRTGEYQGEVTHIAVIRELLVVRNGLSSLVYEHDVEPAPRLTSEEAWTQAPILIVREILERGTRLYESDRRGIRHECYKLLGGSGVKITEPVKGRVRTIIEQVASALHVQSV